MRFQQAESYKHLASMILGSKVFIGNQSFAYSLAEAMKHPRVLEVLLVDSNCMPQSSNGFTNLSQSVLRHLVLGEPPVPERRMDYYVPSVLVKITGITKPVKKPLVSYIIPVESKEQIPASFVEKVTRDGSEVIVIDDADTFEKKANMGAAQAVGKIICVVNPEFAHYAMARTVTALLEKSDGLVGTRMDASTYPYATGPCIAVSRKAYEQCGLFNPAMKTGELNYLEASLRYAKRRYSCKSANISCSFRSPSDTTDNKDYIRKMYGVQI
jgi:hypothetical protein